jgi:hypothetical protein
MASHRKTGFRDEKRTYQFLKSAMNDKKKWDGETGFSARRYNDILQDVDFNFYLIVFSGVLPQAKKLFEIM